MTRSLLPSIFGHDKKERPVFQTLHDEIDRVFDEFRGAMTTFGDKPGAEKNGWLTPKIDVSETDESIEVIAEIPGVKDENIDVSITNNVLVIKGEKSEEHEEKKKDYHLIERSHGNYIRSIPLGFDVETEDAEAAFNDGVLKITIKKPSEIAEKTKKIPINKSA